MWVHIICVCVAIYVMQIHVCFLCLKWLFLFCLHGRGRGELMNAIIELLQGFKYGCVLLLVTNFALSGRRWEPDTKIGLYFEDLTEVYEFYNVYAKVARFSVQKDSTCTKDGDAIWKWFFCSKEGKTDEKHWIDKDVAQRCHTETQVNCTTQMQVKNEKLGGYEVSKFVPGHCPPPTTHHKRFILRSHRIVPKSMKHVLISHVAHLSTH